MRLINSRDFIKTGEYICIENDEGQKLVRLYFSDYPSDQECVEFANKLLNLLKAVKKLKVTYHDLIVISKKSHL